MDHNTIEANQVPDRYLTGKLAAGERAEFEEHYLDCEACLERLESIEGLRAGLKELSSTAATAARVVPFLRRPAAAALIAAACLVLAVLPSTLFLSRARRTADELSVARAAADEMRKENAALTRTLERERKPGPGALAASVFTLSLTRAGGPEAPLDRILLRDAREWTVLLLDRPDAPRGAGVTARLATAEGRPVGGALAASEAADDMLAVGIPPGVLSEGAYVLTLESAGAVPARVLATYRFRAVAGK